MRNEINSLPEFGNLSNLTILSAENLNIQSLPESIRTLENLESLDLSGNFLDVLPTGLLELKHLKFLNLSFNRLWQVPTQLLQQLTGLRHALLAGNGIWEAPDLTENMGIIFYKIFL